MLSARTLAASLATQENPEKGLCSHESAPLPGEQEIRVFRDESNNFRSDSNPSRAGKFISPRGDFEPVSGNSGSENQSQKPKNELQNGNVVKAESQDWVVNNNGNKKCLSKKVPKEKDPKSFTQNLFDTEAMRFLHLAKSGVSFLNWAPWLKEEESHTSRESQGHLGVVGRNSNARTENEQDSHSTQLEPPGTLTSVQKQVKEPTAVIPPLEKRPQPRDDAYVGCQSSHRSQTASPSSLESTSIVSDALVISQKTDDFILQDRPSDDNDLDEIESNDHNMSLAVGETQDFTPKNARKPEIWASIDPTEAASRATEIVTDNPGKIPADPDPDSDPVELPQALGRFTLENISALVDTIKMVHPGPGDGYDFLQSLGRATTISRLSRFVGGTATQQEMSIVFGKQSIIYVLSTIDALLRSFAGSADVVSSDYKQSVNSAEIIQAFRLLMEIDHHPRNIFPSLWISIGKLHPSISFRSKGTLLKACRSTKSDRPLLGSTTESQSVNADFLGDIDAAHVVKIALAALIASIPECNVDTWASVQRLRASGRIAPSFNKSHAETKLIDPLLKVMDSFDDELALSLMMRVVRAVAARQCLVEISRFQEPNTKDGISVNNGEDFMDILLHEVIDSEIKDTVLTQSSAVSTSVGSMATAKSTPIEKRIERHVIPPNLDLSVLVEWLRSVVFSEWDGKAEISRWGPVGGALEFMSHLCEKDLFYKKFIFHANTNSVSARIPPPRGVNPEVFHTPFISDRLDVMEMPAEWLSSKRDRNTAHLLSYPFLFVPSALVSYFRAINYAAMSKAFGSSMVAARLEAQVTFADRITGRGELRLHDRLKIATSNYLVLEIRRGEVLTDALNQLWRRERRELMRPLKVRMGMEEGEEGVDHGGVQQEFFRVALSEALGSDYGKQILAFGSTRVFTDRRDL